MIELLDVSVGQPRRAILDHASVTLPTATMTQLTGRGGSGKSTLVRAIAGVQRYSGRIRFDGLDADRRRSRLYVCFDDAQLVPHLTGYENIRLASGKWFRDSQIVRAAPSLASDSLLRMRARSLNRGQRLRVHFLASLLSAARYIVFDDALGGRDAPTVEELRDAMRVLSVDATVLLTAAEPAPNETDVDTRTLVDGRIL